MTGAPLAIPVGRSLLLIAALCGVATADRREELESKGEALGREGRFSESIAAFKEADKLQPRASHACLIALAYLRRELWPQAEIFLDLCERRATKEDPTPDWVPLAKQQLAEKLDKVEVAPITIEVYPEGVRPKITVSAFAPDEEFGPRTIHLGFGTHEISASAPGYEARNISVRVIDRMPQRVQLELKSLAPPPRPLRPSSETPWYVLGAGAAITAAAIAFDALAFQPVRDELAVAADPAHPDPDRYHRYEASFDARRKVTFALYGVGVTTIAVGIVMRYLDQRERTIRVTAQPLDGGAMVGMEWRR